MVKAGAMVIGAISIPATVIADILYTLLNPRVFASGAPGECHRRDDHRRTGAREDVPVQETIAQLLHSPTFLISVVGDPVLDDLRVPRLPRRVHRTQTFQDANAVLHSASGSNPFGTDQLGQDVLSRVIAGSRSTMEIAPAATALATALGSAIGLVLGYFGGWFDDIVSRLIDTLLAIPGIILLIAVITSLGTSVPTLIVTIGLAFTPIIARTVRAAVLAEAGQDYVQAAKLRGEHAPYILFVEILPNIVPPIIVEATVRLGYAIFDARRHHVPRPRPAAADARLVGRHHRGLLEPERHRPQRLLLAGALPRPRDHLDLRRDRRCSPTASSRCSTDERRTDHGEQTRRRGRGAGARGQESRRRLPRARRSGARCCAASASAIERGSAYGLVGESGCGKSTAALAVDPLPPAQRARALGVDHGRGRRRAGG